MVRHLHSTLKNSRMTKMTNCFPVLIINYVWLFLRMYVYTCMYTDDKIRSVGEMQGSSPGRKFSLPADTRRMMQQSPIRRKLSFPTSTQTHTGETRHWFTHSFLVRCCLLFNIATLFDYYPWLNYEWSILPQWCIN